MSVFTSMGNTLMRAAAVNAIESSHESGLMAEAAQTRKKAAIQQDMASKDIAAALQDFQSTYQIAMDVVSLAQAGQKVGEAGADLAQSSQQGPQIESNFESARADFRQEQGQAEGGQVDLSQSQSFQDLKNTPLGDRTVGDRFNDQQLQVMLDGPEKYSDQQLKDAGFSKAEIGDLRDAQQDGFTTGEARQFMQKHKLTPQEQEGKKFKEDLQKAIRENLNLGVSSAIDGTKENVLEEGRRAKEDLGRADAMLEQLRQRDTAHLKTVGQIHRDVLSAETQKRESGNR